MSSEIVMLCSEGHSSRAIYNALRERWGDFPVIMEQPMSRLEMARKRAKRLGKLKVAGQILFVSAVVPLLHRTSAHRIAEIEAEFGLNGEWGDATVTAVDSVNADRTRQILQSLDPRVVIVNGTRIISTTTLECVNARFINTHAGITPLYRGVHGAYWALSEDRRDLVGTTVHLVDSGIDTGRVIRQAFFKVSDKDNFATYPYLHTATGIPILIAAVETVLSGNLTLDHSNNLESKLRYHPTIFEYVRNRLMRGVK